MTSTEQNGHTYPRARLGLIIPSGNTLTEPQMWRYAPCGVEIHVTRYRLDLKKTIVEQTPEILAAASVLSDARPDVIVYHCTGMSMGAGKASEVELVRLIGETTGRRATSTATAIISAMQALEVRRVVLATPYPPEFNRLERTFLEEYGISVLADRALDLPIPEGMCSATPEVWIDTVQVMRTNMADAYFVSCTNIQSMEAIEPLERLMDRPVITSNQAALWYALRSCGIQDKVPALGRLFELDGH